MIQETSFFQYLSVSRKYFTLKHYTLIQVMLAYATKTEQPAVKSTTRTLKSVDINKPVNADDGNSPRATVSCHRLSECQKFTHETAERPILAKRGHGEQQPADNYHSSVANSHRTHQQLDNGLEIIGRQYNTKCHF
jgi:hypothetical protein